MPHCKSNYDNTKKVMEIPEVEKKDGLGQTEAEAKAFDQRVEKIVDSLKGLTYTESKRALANAQWSVEKELVLN